MAEGLARYLGGGRLRVASAGTEPSAVHPLAVGVMRERGVDIGGQRSESLDRYLGRTFDEVITVCDRAARNCPVFPGTAARTHWPIDDPAAVEGDRDRRLDAFRAARDELERRLVQWLEELQPELPSAAEDQV